MARLEWGFGAAPLLKKRTQEETEKVVFLPDTHVPYHDVDLLKSALKVVRKVKPHRVVHLGDLLDFHSISRWNAKQERIDDLQDELDEAAGLLSAIRKAAPDAAIDFIKGNHDDRLERYVAIEARALTSLRTLDLMKQLDTQELEIDVHEANGIRIRPNFIAKHGTIIRKEPGYTAKAELEAAGISGISGHTHRLAQYHKNGYTKSQWTEAGTLSRLDPPFMVGIPNWSPGLAVGYFSTKGDGFLVETVNAVDGHFMYGGRLL